MNFLIAHCGWSKERRHRLDRMLHDLEVGGAHDLHVSRSERPEHAFVWARRLWEEAASYDAPSVLLNDDVLLHPRFVEICRAIAEAVPGEVVSLHTNAPAAIDAARAGHHWARCYYYTGPAVILTPEQARDLLAFWEAIPWDYASRANEDVVAIMWAWANQHPMLCAIPAPVIHDTTTASTLGYDAHANRTPTVPWHEYTPPGADLTDPAYWKPTGKEPTVENPWMPVSKMETIRRTLAEGQHVCFMCLASPGVVGTKEVSLCNACLVKCTTARIMGKS